MVLFNEIFVSELEGRPLIDRREDKIGKIIDVVISPLDSFPRVLGFLVHLFKEKKQVLVLLSCVDLIGRKFISLKEVREKIVFTTLRPDEMLLVRDVLDQQIVDINGARVVRVNDLKLSMVNADVRLVAADISFWGMLRRLGLSGLQNFLGKVFKIKFSDVLIPWNYVEQISRDVSKVKLTVEQKTVADLHPADIANILSQVHGEERTKIFESLSADTAADALHELEPVIQAYLISSLDTKKTLNILEKMPPDEIADVLGDLTEDKREELLRLMKPKKSGEVKKLLLHHEETAGGLMTTEFISLPETLTAEETIARLRELAPNTETIYYLYVVNLLDQLVGILSLRRLIVAQPQMPISEIMIKKVFVVGPQMSQRQVADIISKYNLLAVPVVDSDRKILGIVTVDDVVDFIIPPLSKRKRQMVG